MKKIKDLEMSEEKQPDGSLKVTNKNQTIEFLGDRILVHTEGVSSVTTYHLSQMASVSIYQNLQIDDKKRLSVGKFMHMPSIEIPLMLAGGLFMIYLIALPSFLILGLLCYVFGINPDEHLGLFLVCVFIPGIAFCWNWVIKDKRALGSEPELKDFLSRQPCGFGLAWYYNRKPVGAFHEIGHLSDGQVTSLGDAIVAGMKRSRQHKSKVRVDVTQGGDLVSVDEGVLTIRQHGRLHVVPVPFVSNFSVGSGGQVTLQASAGPLCSFPSIPKPWISGGTGPLEFQLNLPREGLLAVVDAIKDIQLGR